VGFLLAIDTSTRYAGIALARDGEVIEHLWRSNQNHGTELLPAIERLLGDASADFSDIDRVGVATGPGGFSALRVGLATAKGLALPANLPIVGISTHDLEAMPSWPPSGPLVAVIDAGSSGLVWARYEPPGESAEVTLPPAHRRAAGVAPPERLADAMPTDARFCGEAVERLAGVVSADRLLGEGPPTRRPADLATLAAARLDAGDADDPAALAPNYGREPSISTPAR
jgi:tRNA threonylcarbamoyladenosine biosynthesis protein TsaB